MIRNYQINIEGVTPLLMHQDNIEWCDQMEGWRHNPANKKLSKAGDDRTPAFRWIGSLYHDDKVVCMASDNLSKCLLEGGSMVTVPGGRAGKTFKAQTQSGMKLDDAFSPLIVNGKNIPMEPIRHLEKESAFAAHVQKVREMGFKLFVKRARIGTQKHIRVRPRFDTWALVIRCSVWDEQITTAVLEDICNYGGSYKGLGDWRPGSKTPGAWGTFKATVKPL